MIRLIYVGRLVYQKGLDIVLKILASKPGLELLILGAGKELSNLKKIVANENLLNRVKFLGYINKFKRYFIKLEERVIWHQNSFKTMSESYCIYLNFDARLFGCLRFMKLSKYNMNLPNSTYFAFRMLRF